MARRGPSLKLLAYTLVLVLTSSASAQSLGDLARDERRQKSSSTSDSKAAKVFSNVDDPPSQVIAPNMQNVLTGRSGTQPVLQIESPAEGAIVSPGEVLGVRVTSRTQREWEFVGVLAAIPNVPPTEAAHSFPAEFSIAIPTDVNKCGRHVLTAMARISGGELVESVPIEIDIERPDMPVSLWSQFGSLIFENPGQELPMILTATFPDGKVLDVGESSRISFRSTDPSVVSVDGTGKTTAAATGNASIVVSYRNPAGPDRQLTIPVMVRRFQVTFAPTSLDFGNVPVGSTAKLSVMVTNNTAAKMQLRINSIEVLGPFSASGNCGSSSSPPVGASCEIRVTYMPTAAGHNSGTLSVYDSMTGGPSKILLGGIGLK